MNFSILAGIFEKMENTTKRLELTDHLVELFNNTPPDLISKIIYLIQGKLRPDYEGVEIGIAEKLAVRAVSKSSGIQVAEIEDVFRDDGDLGAAASKILSRRKQTTFVAQVITVERVYDTLYKIAKLQGSNSQERKIKYISSLLNDANPTEARFMIKLLLGTLRLGIAENTVMDGLALAFTGNKKNRQIIEDAYNVSSDLGEIANTVCTGGVKALCEFNISVFRPIRPMLADRVKSEAEAVEKMGDGFAAEYKLDGERVQIHTKDGQVQIFSRSLENVTKFYPDIKEDICSNLKCSNAILEAEAVAINPATGNFLPFQELMHRRKKHGIKKAVAEYPISVNFFDALYVNGHSYLDSGYVQRRAILEKTVKEGNFAKCIMAITVNFENDIVEFMEDSINSGAEGLMLKMPNSPYMAGARGNHWLKLKREYRNELGDSLDLVVIGAYFGKGRRTGRYGTLLLATYDDNDDSFSSICKVGTGFTDEHLDQLYQILSGSAASKKDTRVKSDMVADVWFPPELVIEVVASEITLSPIHKTAFGVFKKDTGLALRFPKFTGRIRSDKLPEAASTWEEVVSLYKAQNKSKS
ncbi:MAG: ATP-dependent DNA ligase [Cenarchaeum symbiont of Oopsacas minuta]|nr:ATP-dependent DNA ligase [Cenarchaeum symbiont of Oopsacas minuta]